METWREELYANELYHYGVKGMKWRFKHGKKGRIDQRFNRNDPPYSTGQYDSPQMQPNARDEKRSWNKKTGLKQKPVRNTKRSLKKRAGWKAAGQAAVTRILRGANSIKNSTSIKDHRKP